MLTLHELPPANDLTQALLKILREPDASIEQLARVIETDASLTAQTLRHARSPYYGYAGEIESVADAITRVLGFDTVLMTSLAIASGKSLQIPRQGRIGKEALCRHSLYSAVLAKTLTRYIPSERGVSPQRDASARLRSGSQPCQGVGARTSDVAAGRWRLERHGRGPLGRGPDGLLREATPQVRCGTRRVARRPDGALEQSTSKQGVWPGCGGGGGAAVRS